MAWRLGKHRELGNGDEVLGDGDRSLRRASGADPTVWNAVEWDSQNWAGQGDGSPSSAAVVWVVAVAPRVARLSGRVVAGLEGSHRSRLSRNCQ